MKLALWQLQNPCSNLNTLSWFMSPSLPTCGFLWEFLLPNPFILSLLWVSRWLRDYQVTQRWRICLSVQETQEMWVTSLAQEDLLEEMTTHSSILGKSLDRGTWWAIVHRTAERLNWACTRRHPISVGAASFADLYLSSNSNSDTELSPSIWAIAHLAQGSLPFFDISSI